MESKTDLEKILRRFRHKPDPSVKQSVMDRFESKAASASPVTIRSPLWRKRVPAYAVAVLLVVCVICGFVAGRQSAGITSTPDTTPDTNLTTAEEIPWYTSARDLL